jgi:hypothetical protein
VGVPGQALGPTRRAALQRADVAAATDRIDVVLAPSPHNRFAEDVAIVIKVGVIILDWIGAIMQATGKTDNPPQTPGATPPHFNAAFVAGLNPNHGSPPLAGMLAHVAPDKIPFNQLTPLRIDASDQTSGAPVQGQVWASLVVAPLGTGGGRLLGNTGETVLAALQGRWVPTAQNRPGHPDFHWVNEHLYVVAPGHLNAVASYEMVNLPPTPGRHLDPVLP